MKTTTRKSPRPVFLLAAALLLNLASCKKDLSPVQDLNKTVPVTQSGANTFGCLINGQVFTASDKLFKPKNVGGEYQGMYSMANNLASFYVNGSRNTATNVYVNVSIRMDSVAFTIGQTIPLGKDTTGSASGAYEVDNYGVIGAGARIVYSTTASNPGTLTITHIDPIYGIVSGTFSFAAVNSEGQTVSIVDGRFDVRASL